jgi:hypothetical protein
MKLRANIMKGDPRIFLSWEEIKKSMFYEPPIEELLLLKKSKNWPKFEKALQENENGRPYPYYAYKKTSGNLINHAYAVSQLIDHTAYQVESEKLVVELGGGYGSMCRLFFNMGFKGQYFVFDFPEFLALQKYFLTSIGIRAEFYDKENQGNDSQVILFSDLEDLKKNMEAKNGFLFIATWSLSESPLHFRREFLDSINNPGYFLIGFQDRFGEVSNADYFNELTLKYAKHSWIKSQVPGLSANHYLIGERKL